MVFLMFPLQLFKAPAVVSEEYRHCFGCRKPEKEMNRWGYKIKKRSNALLQPLLTLNLIL